jgi:hypothetical protein
MSTLSHIDTEAARFNPESTFDHPRQIVDAIGLTLGQKVATLRRWEELVTRRLAATSEGMPPNGTTDENVRLLDLIHAAQAEIDALPSPDL